MWVAIANGVYMPITAFERLDVREPVTGTFQITGTKPGGTTVGGIGGVDYTSRNDGEAALALLLQQVGVYDVS